VRALTGVLSNNSQLAIKKLKPESNTNCSYKNTRKNVH